MENIYNKNVKKFFFYMFMASMVFVRFLQKNKYK